MLKIRLSRSGKKYEPHYKIVVAETRSKRDGKIIEQIGHWHPKSEQLTFNHSAYKSWIEKGAKPTLAVKGLEQK